MAPKKRHRLILRALLELGGEATTKDIADRTQLNVNGVSQSLGAMFRDVERLDGRGGETRWRLLPQDKVK